MKVQKIIEAKERFKPYKIIVEVSVESEEDHKLLLALKNIATDLFLSDEDGNTVSSFKEINTKQEDQANALIQNILSNL